MPHDQVTRQCAKPCGTYRV
ncbi:hypothetical protein F383_05333 [Gossypium arboreum]|uniref:Uncharacterized protein n=1 Tax=Gossypium arboreum TaxID=29729 RepID=A0A0B0PDD8_GOSAR|nr:hypothetical protein F383_05333 [Gossypium arboreum]